MKVEPSAPSTVSQDDETLNAQGVYQRVKSAWLQLEENSRTSFDIERANQVQSLSRHLITREDGIVVENINPQQLHLKVYGCKSLRPDH